MEYVKIKPTPELVVAKIVVPEGTHIFDEGGHLVCVAVQDCYAGEVMEIRQFKWYVSTPNAQEPVHPALMHWLRTNVR